MELPHITDKQQEILKLLYKYRFLNRIQIQQLMNHKDKKRIIAWLKDLREKQCAEWIYSTNFLEKTKPAIYYLSLNGIRFLRAFVWSDGSGRVYPIEGLRKRYKEKGRSRTFIDRSLLIADCCLTLERASCTSKSDAGNSVSYAYITESDYADPDHAHHFLAEHESLRPNLYIIKTDRKSNGKVTTNYLLEIFDSTLPDYRLRFRLKAYFKYLIEGDWEAETGDDNPPVILLVYPKLADLINAKRRIRKLLLDEYYEAADMPKNLHIRFTTTEQLQQQSITAPIWEERKRQISI